MARKRMIDPDFWTDEALGACGPTVRLLFMGLISQADDDGRLRGTPALIRSQVFPYDEIPAYDVDQYLKELHDRRLIQRYEIDGQSYIWIHSFGKHQTINKPTPSRLPPPPCRPTEPPLPEDSGSPTVALPSNRREEKRREEKTADAAAPPRVDDPLFEVVAEVCYGGGLPYAEFKQRLSSTNRSRINKALTDLKRIGVSVADVRGYAANYRARSPDFPLKPQTIVEGITEHVNKTSQNGRTSNATNREDSELARQRRLAAAQEAGLIPHRDRAAS